jgi:hypothetical protein
MSPCGLHDHSGQVGSGEGQVRARVDMNEKYDYRKQYTIDHIVCLTTCNQFSDDLKVLVCRKGARAILIQY